MIDLVNESLQNLRRSGVKTFLTLIGIVIGIAAIVALLSVGAGVTATFEEQFESLGSNTIMVSPGDAFSTQSSSTVKIAGIDVRYIKGLTNVNDVIQEYASPVAITYDNQVKSAVFFTIDKEGFDFFKSTDFVTLTEGRWIESNEASSIMISDKMAKDSFDKEINLRKQLNLNGENYKVVGIFKLSAAMSSMAGGGGGMVLTSVPGYERLYSVDSPVELMVKTINVDVVDQTAEQIKTYFENKYGKKSMTILTMEQSVEQVGMILGMLTIFIVGLAGISLIVGGIGIMNAMVTSVMERTKEIGLYKALGASSRKILTLFLLEAGFIGLIGGIIGVIFGLIGAQLITVVANAANFPIKGVIVPEIILGALGFAIIVGMLSGFYPALRASKLDPVEALRYE